MGAGFAAQHTHVVACQHIDSTHCGIHRNKKIICELAHTLFRGVLVVFGAKPV
jgi:hypothetical protein